MSKAPKAQAPVTLEQPALSGTNVVTQPSRHRERAVTREDYRSTAPAAPGANVQRAPRPQPGAGAANVETPTRAGAMRSNAARMREAQQMRGARGAQDLRNMQGLGGANQGRMGDVGAGGAGSPMTRMRGSQGSRQGGGGIAGPSAESNENGSYVTGVRSGGGSSSGGPGYLPGFEPRQGGGGAGSKNGNKGGGFAGGMGMPGGNGGGDDNKPGGGFADLVNGGTPGNDNKSRRVESVGGKANENKPIVGVAGGASKPADDKPKGGEKPADKPQEKPQDKPKDDKPQDKPQGDKPQGDKPAGDKPKDGDKPDKSMTSSTPTDDAGGGGPVGPRFGGSLTNPGRGGAGVTNGPRIGLGERGAINPADNLGGAGPAGARMLDQGKLVNPGAGGPERP